MAATSKAGLTEPTKDNEPAKTTAAPKAKKGLATVTYSGKEAVKVGGLRWQPNTKRADGTPLRYHPNKQRRVMPVAEAQQFKGHKGFKVEEQE